MNMNENKKQPPVSKVTKNNLGNNEKKQDSINKSQFSSKKATKFQNKSTNISKNLDTSKFFSLKKISYLFLIILTIGILTFQFWYFYHEILEINSKSAMRSKKINDFEKENEILKEKLNKTYEILNEKVLLLEAFKDESNNKKSELDEIYKDFIKNRDQWTLAEIEQTISVASQQLQLTGNIDGALYILNNADLRLKKSNRKDFIEIRRAISEDIENLIKIQRIDLEGLVIKLDNLISIIDKLPLISDFSESYDEKNIKENVDISDKDLIHENKAKIFYEKIKIQMFEISNNFVKNFLNLIKIQNLENPHVILLNSKESFFIKENLKLRLLSSRSSLLSKEEVLFKGDIMQAKNTLNLYFDEKKKKVKDALIFLESLQKISLNINRPNLNNSLNLIKKYRR
tara:strand:- start:1564 stop:2766 length:1203 start_codon:yes stop_codon:yes gene_type:complete